MRKHMGTVKTAAAIVTAALLLGGCGGTSEPAQAEPSVVMEPIAETAPEEKPEEKPAAEPEEKKTPATCQEIYDAVAAEVTLPALYYADDDFLMNYYGIDAAMLSDYIFASSEDAARVDSVILMRLGNEADADAVMEGLNGLLEQMETEMENYLPEAYELVKDAAVRRNGDFLDLVISEDREKIQAVIDRMVP